MVKMLACAVVLCLVGASALASPARGGMTDSASPIHIIRPPVRCPEGMKPDANGRCRVVWDKSLDGSCPPGQVADGDGACRQSAEAPECFGEDCPEPKKVEKRDHGFDLAEALDYPNKHGRMEALRSEKRTKKRSNPEEAKAGKQARSKHAFLIMLKKKKMQMMKPKPPPPPPPPPHHHHPPHPEESEEPPEEDVEEDTPAPQRLFFGDDPCIDAANSTGVCPPGAEIIQGIQTDDFKEWKPDESSESSQSEDSSSSDSTGESGSEGGSGESEDEVLQKAIKIKLMKLFRMKQRYGPALRRWLVAQLREYEDSFDH